MANPLCRTYMSSRIYFEGEIEGSTPVARYSTSRSYIVGNHCTDLYVDELGHSSYILLKCIADTSGDWKNQAEKNDIKNKWTITWGNHTYGELKVVVNSTLLKSVTLKGSCDERKKIALQTDLELTPGKYQFGGMQNQSSTKYHMEFGEYNSLESTTFTVTKTVKKTLYLVVEPNFVFAEGDKNNTLSLKLYEFTGNNWKYHWNPSDWDFDKSAKGYDYKKQYKPGNKVVHDFSLYQCTTMTPAGGEQFNPGHWAQVMEDTREWTDHVDFYYGKNKHRKAYLYTNSVMDRYDATNGTTTKNGLTIEIQNRGRKVIVSGTPTADTKITVASSCRVDANHACYMDGCPSGESKNKHYLQWGEYKSYDGRAYGGKNGPYHELDIVIKKQSKPESGKDVYDNDEFVPELNDIACYDSNCNGLIWQKWVTDLDGGVAEIVFPNDVRQEFKFNDSILIYHYYNQGFIYSDWLMDESLGIISGDSSTEDSGANGPTCLVNGLQAVVITPYEDRFKTRQVHIYAGERKWKRFFRMPVDSVYRSSVINRSPNGFFLGTLKNNGLITVTNWQYDEESDTILSDDVFSGSTSSINYIGIISSLKNNHSYIYASTSDGYSVFYPLSLVPSRGINMDIVRWSDYGTYGPLPIVGSYNVSRLDYGDKSYAWAGEHSFSPMPENTNPLYYRACMQVYAIAYAHKSIYVEQFEDAEYCYERWGCNELFTFGTISSDGSIVYKYIYSCGTEVGRLGPFINIQKATEKYLVGIEVTINGTNISIKETDAETNDLCEEFIYHNTGKSYLDGYRDYHMTGSYIGMGYYNDKYYYYNISQTKYTQTPGTPDFEPEYTNKLIIYSSDDAIYWDKEKTVEEGTLIASSINRYFSDSIDVDEPFGKVSQINLRTPVYYAGYNGDIGVDPGENPNSIFSYGPDDREINIKVSDLSRDFMVRFGGELPMSQYDNDYLLSKELVYTERTETSTRTHYYIAYLHFDSPLLTGFRGFHISNKHL